jgi:hypothetical protein
MFKATITNSILNRQWTGSFATMDELNDWQDRQIAKNSFGLPDRWVLETDGTHDSERDLVVNGETVLDGEGNPVKEYHFPVDYTIAVEDVTTEVAVKNRIAQNQKAGRIATQICQEVLEYIQGINSGRSGTSEEKKAAKNAMKSGFAPILSELKNNDPSEALELIKPVVADGSIVTDEMKSDILEIFKQYGLE